MNVNFTGHAIVEGTRPPRPSARRRLLVLASSLTPLLRTGFGLLGVGGALDLGYHLLTGFRAHHEGGLGAVGFAIHMIVLAGMVLTMAGVFQKAFRRGELSTKSR